MRSFPPRLTVRAWDFGSAAPSWNRTGAACGLPTILRAAQLFSSPCPRARWMLSVRPCSCPDAYLDEYGSSGVVGSSLDGPQSPRMLSSLRLISERWLTRPLRQLLACPLPKGYSPPASTQSFATDVKHLRHQLRHIDGSRSVAQDARVSEHGLRNHMPTVLDLVQGNDRRRRARPQESIR